MQNSLQEYQFRNRKPYMMSGWLDDVLGIDVSKTLQEAGQNAIDAAKEKALSDIATSDKVQSAVTAQAQKSAAQIMADQLLANKQAIMYGGIAIGALVLWSLLRK